MTPKRSRLCLEVGSFTRYFLVQYLVRPYDRIDKKLTIHCYILFILLYARSNYCNKEYRVVWMRWVTPKTMLAVLDTRDSDLNPVSRAHKTRLLLLFS